MNSIKYFQVFTYLLTAAVIVAIGFMSNELLDVTIYDTYFVIAHNHIGLVLALPFVLYGIVSFIFVSFDRPMNKIMFWIHWLGSILALLGVLILTSYLFNTPPARYDDYSVYQEIDKEISRYDTITTWQLIFVLVFLVVQVVFLVNCIATIFQIKR